MLWRSISCLLVFLALSATAVADDAKGIVEASGVRGGLVVVLGVEDAEALGAYRVSDSYLVQGLDTDPVEVAEARAFLTENGLYGKTSADSFDGKTLPYVDNLVNLVIAADGCEVAEEEILRVLAPRGVAMIDGKKTVKPVPSAIDEWSHHMYNATGIGSGRDTVVGPPRHIQWKAGPEYSRSHENMSSVSAVVAAGGRVFSIIDEGPIISLYLPCKWTLSARDAFSGVLLWKVPIQQWHTRFLGLKSGPLQLPRRLVASDKHVYVTLGLEAPVSQVDATTGKVLKTWDETKQAEELLLVDGKLVVVTHTGENTKPRSGRLPPGHPGPEIHEKTINLSGSRTVMLIDTATCEIVWKTEPSEIVPLTTAADAGKVFFLSGADLVCVDMQSGKTLWTKSGAGAGGSSTTTFSPTLLVHKRIVYVAIRGKLTARDVNTGDDIWSGPCAGNSYKTPVNIYVVDNVLWDINVSGNSGGRTFHGYDLRTGKAVKEIVTGNDHGYAVMHHRCHVPRASGSNIITSFPGIEFFDTNTGESSHDSWIRGACLFGFVPANGLISDLLT